MAQHQATSGTGLRAYRSHFGHFPMRGYGEAAASTFKTGDVLMQGTSTDSHRVVEASSNATTYVGIAASDATSNTGDVASVYEGRHGNTFIGWVKETIMSTMVGEYRHFARDTTMAIDYLSAATTNARVQITEVGLQDIAGGPYDIGDTNGYVAFEFVVDHTAFGPNTPPAQS